MNIGRAEIELKAVSLVLAKIVLNAAKNCPPENEETYSKTLIEIMTKAVVIGLEQGYKARDRSLQTIGEMCEEIEEATGMTPEELMDKFVRDVKSGSHKV